MKLNIKHVSKYKFSNNLTYGVQRLRLKPQNNKIQNVNKWDINVKGGICTFDEEGNCVEYKLCTQDWRHPRNIETCSEIDEHRAWSSPIYVDYLL